MRLYYHPVSSAALRAVLSLRVRHAEERLALVAVATDLTPAEREAGGVWKLPEGDVEAVRLGTRDYTACGVGGTMEPHERFWGRHPAPRAQPWMHDPHLFTSFFSRDFSTCLSGMLFTSQRNRAIVSSRHCFLPNRPPLPFLIGHLSRPSTRSTVSPCCCSRTAGSSRSPPWSSTG